MANTAGAGATGNATIIKGDPVSDTNIWLDPPDGATFTFDRGSRIQFRDGRNMRTGFVTRRGVRESDGKPGYEVFFKMKETNQNRLVWWLEFDLAAAPEETFRFKKGDKVVVFDGVGDRGQSGVVFDRRGATIEQPEPQYAVLLQNEDGRSDLAWWGEFILAEDGE